MRIAGKGQATTPRDSRCPTKRGSLDDPRMCIEWQRWAGYVRRRPITTEAIGSAATHPSLRGALATKQSRGQNMRGASNPDGRIAAPGLLRFARNDGQGIGSLVSACRLSEG